MMYAQQQQAAMQAQYAQQQAYEEHMRQQQMLYAQQLAQSQQQPIQPQATGFGANNPFAAFASSSSPAPPSQPQPIREPSPPPPQPQPQAQQQETTIQPQRTGPRFRADGDSKHGELAKMLAGGREDGLDTFGNVGSSRVPVWQQKTGIPKQGGGGGQFTMQYHETLESLLTIITQTADRELSEGTKKTHFLSPLPSTIRTNFLYSRPSASRTCTST